jgi:hypothetical protein
MSKKVIREGACKGGGVPGRGGGGGIRRVADGRPTITCYLAVATRHHRI